MRRSGFYLLSVAFLLPSALLAQRPSRPHHGRAPSPYVCGVGCGDPQPRAQIIATTWDAAARDLESGPFSYSITVANYGDGAGVVGILCVAPSGQITCGAVSPPATAGTYLEYGETQDFVVSFSTKGVGQFPLKFVAVDGVDEAVTHRDSVTFNVVTQGASLQTHLVPVEGQKIQSTDTLKSLFQPVSAAAISTSTIKVYMDGVDVTSSGSVSGTTISLPVTSLALGPHVFSSYGCNTAGRCDQVTTSFTRVGTVTSYALDDSIPPGTGEGLFGLLPGALPLPPVGQRGCPVENSNPDILLNTPYSYGYQYGSPAGYIFLPSVFFSDSITIASTTVDNPANNTRTCHTLTYLTYNQYDPAYWNHTDPADSLWLWYPYGDRGGLTGGFAPINGAPRVRHVPGGPDHPVGPDWGQAHGGGGNGNGGGGHPGPFANAAGPIDTASYWVTLNGTYIIQNGHGVYTGVTRSSMAAIGSTFQLPASAAIVNRYDPVNPASSPNGGWNEMIAGISDSSGNETTVRVRFVVVGQGPSSAIALTPMRDESRQDQGGCAAFGSFQCGSVVLTQAIPGYVTRDKEHALHLIYRSASQPVTAAIPYQMRISRLQKAPDSLRIWATVNGVAVPDSMQHRYAGLKCMPSCGHELLWPNVNETRVVEADLPAASGSGAFGGVKVFLRSWYAGAVRDDSALTDAPRFYLTDTTTTLFGPGWQLAELGRLLFYSPSGESPAVVYLRGDGSFSVYRNVGGAFVSPPGDRSRLVIRNDGDLGYYAIEFPDGSAVGFQSNGQQRYTRDLVGNKTYFNFTGNRLNTIIDPTGWRYSFEYIWGSGRVDQIFLSPPGGSAMYTVNFNWDGNGRLSSYGIVSGVDSVTHYELTQYTYASGAPGAFVTSVVDPRGNTSDVTYDARYWLPTSTTRPPYLGQRDVASYRDPLRRAAPREGYGHGGTSQVQERLLYLNQARGTFVGIADTPTDVEVDRFASPTMVRHFAPPQSLYWNASGIPDELRNIDRDSVGRVTRIVAGRDYYGSTADSVSYEYDASGNLLRLIRTTAQFPAAGLMSDTTSYTYDSVTTGLAFTGQRCIRMRTMRDPMGGLDSVTYGSSGVAQCLPLRMRGIAGDTAHYFYGSLAAGNTAGTRPVAIVDATGARDSVAYDATTWNSLANVRVSDGTVSRVLHYDTHGRADSVVDAVGVLSVSLHDWFGRVTASRTGAGLEAPVSRMFYRMGSQVDSVRVYGTSGSVGGTPGTPVQTTRYTYNALGWLDTTVTPAGRRQYARHDRLGHPYFEYTGNGSYVARLYDFVGHMTTEYQSQSRPGYTVDGQPFADAATTTAINYFNLTPGLTLSNGVQHAYVYNERGWLTTMLDSTSTTQRSYAPNGTLTSETIAFQDGASVVRRFTYNRRGQRRSAADTVYVGGSRLGTHERYFAYNDTTARLSEMSGYTGSSSWYFWTGLGYDAAGRETYRSVSLLGTGPSIVTNTGYDPQGRRQSVVTTAGSSTWYSFRASGSYGSYDELDRLRVATALEPAPSGGVADNPVYTFTYDNAGGTGRLLTSNRSGLQSTNYTWRYDVFGNRRHEDCTSVQSACNATDSTRSDSLDNRILWAQHLNNSSSAYFHDRAGNRILQLDSTNHAYTGAPTGIMSYTAKGQLFFSMTPTASTSNYDYNWHWYNGEGLRTISHLQGGSTWLPGMAPTSGTRAYYIYDGADVSMMLMRQGSAWWIAQRLMTGGVDQPMGGYFYTNGGLASRSLALITDYQGTARAAIRSDGTQESEATLFSRSPFGALQGATGAGNASTSYNVGAGFAGASTPNAAGGFTYLRNRWYDPQTGRFLSQDPIGLAGGVNLYSYAGNNPVAYSDPFGLWPRPVHEMMIYHGLRGRMSTQDIAKVQASSTHFDHSVVGQTPAYAYEHAMRAVGESPSTAVAAANAFVRGRLAEARADESAGDHDGALQAFGQAVHVLTDRTSPAHTDDSGNPKPWVPVPGVIGAHKNAESGRPSEEQLQKSDRMIQAAYHQVFGGQ
jgi:RHS repeat-associated protein